MPKFRSPPLWLPAGMFMSSSSGTSEWRSIELLVSGSPTIVKRLTRLKRPVEDAQLPALRE